MFLKNLLGIIIRLHRDIFSHNQTFTLLSMTYNTIFVSIEIFLLNLILELRNIYYISVEIKWT